MEKRKFKCIKFKQDGKTLYSSALKVEDILEFSMVHRYNPDLPYDDPKQGYQRKEEARYKKLRKHMSSTDRLLPTAILLNVRDGIEYSSDTSEIIVDFSKKIYIVDGQHRLAGLKYAIEKSKHDPQHQKGVKNFPLPVVFMSGLDKMDEMKQFRIINDYQKKISTGLVRDILAQISRTEGDEEMEQKERVGIVCAEITKILNSASDSPWKNLILEVNQNPITPKQRSQSPELRHIRVIRATSVQTSLKPIYKYLIENEHLDSRASLQVQAQEVAKYVKEYWKAIKELAEGTKMFKEPGDFVLQRTPGMFALHMVMKKLLPRMFRKREEWIKKGFKARLQSCDDINRESYWKAKNGDASVYGSMKGFAELAGKLWDQISEEE